MTIIDDPCDIGIVRDMRITSGHRIRIGIDKFLFPILVEQDIIGRDTGLAGINGFAEQNTRNRFFHGVFIGNDGRRLTTHFQCNGRQVPGCRHHDSSADFGIAGIHQMIEGQTGKIDG